MPSLELIPVYGKLRQEDCLGFRVSLAYQVRLSQREKKKKKTKLKSEVEDTA